MVVLRPWVQMASWRDLSRSLLGSEDFTVNLNCNLGDDDLETALMQVNR